MQLKIFIFFIFFSQIINSCTAEILEFQNVYYPNYYLQIANMEFEQKNFKGAIDYYNKVLQLDSNNKVAYINRGNAKFNLKNYEGAINDYNKVLFIDPNNKVAYINRGNAKFNLKNYEGAINDYNKVLFIDSNNKEAYLSRGNAKFNLKNYEGAINDYNKVLFIDSNNKEAYLNRGNAKFNLKKYDDAINDYNLVKEIYPSADIDKKIYDTKRCIIKECNIKNINKYINLNVIIPIVLLIIWGCFQNLDSYIEMFDAKINYDLINNMWCLLYRDGVTLDSPKPQLSSFGLDAIILKELDDLYRSVNKYGDVYSPNIIFLLGLSYIIFLYLNDKILSYIIDPNYNFCIIFLLSIIFTFPLYLSLKYYINKLKYEIYIIPNYKFSYKIFRNYVLYKKIMQKYNEEISILKAQKEKAIQDALLKQKSYWKAYWEKARNNGFLFEREVAKLYRKLGYNVIQTKNTGDGGVDLILDKNQSIIIVQCKAHKYQVGPEPVRALWGVREDFKAQKAIFIAYAGVTTGAKNFAKNKNIDILDVNDLIQLSIQANS